MDILNFSRRNFMQLLGSLGAGMFLGCAETRDGAPGAPGFHQCGPIEDPHGIDRFDAAHEVRGARLDEPLDAGRREARAQSRQTGRRADDVSQCAQAQHEDPFGVGLQRMDPTQMTQMEALLCHVSASLASSPGGR